MWRMEIREMEGKDSGSECGADKPGHWARDSGLRTHRAWAREKMVLLPSPGSRSRLMFVLTKSFFCGKEKEGR